jgi:hypothetical protein
MASTDAEIYEFRIAGHLDDQWSVWFDDITIACHDDGTSTLTGPVADQAQLYGSWLNCATSAQRYCRFAR